MVKKFKSQMMAHFFNPSDPDSTIEFFPTFKLSCDTNNVHENADMWMPFFVKNALAKILNSRMFAAACINPVVASVDTADPLIQNNIL